MNQTKKQLVREQLDKTLGRFVGLKGINPPRKGWIRAIRDALNMSARQLGNRVGVNKTRISRIESDELSGSVTIKTMRRVADALDCVFVYGFVPRESLESTLKKQADIVARERMNSLAHTMALEDQGLPEKEQQKVYENIVDDLVKNTPKALWEKNK